MREQLLRQALESGKTVSKKQRAKQASAVSSGVPSRSSSKANSVANSRAGSAATSRTGSQVGSSAGSDDEFESENGFDSDEGTSELDFPAKLGEQLEGIDSWERALRNRIDNILASGKRNEDERLDDLRWYTGILQNHYAAEEIQFELSQIIKQLLRASRSGKEKESLLALKALGVTVVTDQSEDYFELCANALKSLVNNSADEDVKSSAVHTLSIVTFISGSEADTLSVLTFLLEIVESDGSSVLAGDSVPVVATSIKALGLLSSKLPDLNPDADYLQDVDRELSQETVEALSEQLESSATSIQVAAAEAIALLFEKSYRRVTPDDYEDLEEDVHTGKLPVVVQKYNPYRQSNQLILQLQEVSKGSSKATAKGDRRVLNEVIRDVVQSIENPGWGPGYRAGPGWKAKDRDDRFMGLQHDRGASIRIRTDQRGNAFLVERWWVYARVKELRNLLGHGFMEHFADNTIVEQVLFHEYESADGSDESSEEEPNTQPMPRSSSKPKHTRKNGAK